MSGQRPRGEDIREDNRKTFFNPVDIKHRSLGGYYMLSPYDAWAYCHFANSDAYALSATTKTEKIRDNLPNLGFETRESAKKRLEIFMIRPEAQLGVTYFIREKNIPVGMILINSPLLNKPTLGVSVWTLDFYIVEYFEHSGLMSVALGKALREMKQVMGVKDVYALTHADNIACQHLLESKFFEEVHCRTFYDTRYSGKTFKLYWLDLTTINFIDPKAGQHSGATRQ